MEDVVKKGDVIKIEFTGKTKEDNKVFDTTNEEVAKKEGIWTETAVYKPLPLVVGKELVIKGLDEALEGKKVGEEFTVEIEPEKGFGKRDSKLIITVSESELLNMGVKPEVGKYIRIGNLTGKIVAISGGRVTIDFNHPLAGRTLIYEVKIVSKATTIEDKVKYITEFVFPKTENINVTVNDSVATIEVEDSVINDSMFKEKLKLLKKLVTESVEEISKIKFLLDLK